MTASITWSNGVFSYIPLSILSEEQRDFFMENMPLCKIGEVNIDGAVCNCISLEDYQTCLKQLKKRRQGKHWNEPEI